MFNQLTSSRRVILDIVKISKVVLYTAAKGMEKTF